MPLKDLFSRHHALRITAIYLAFATLWILASDRVVEALFGDIALLTHMQTLKGMIFVVVTALMLYLLIARAHLAPKAASANNQLTPWAPLLIFSMLAIAISLTGWYSYNALKRSLEQDVIADLTRTGNLKRTQVEAWLNERRADVIVATHESFLAREAQLFQTSVESPPLPFSRYTPGEAWHLPYPIRLLLDQPVRPERPSPNACGGRTGRAGQSSQHHPPVYPGEKTAISGFPYASG